MSILIQKLYNPLGKLVKGVKRLMMTSTVIAFGTMMVPIGFSLLGLYFLDPNHNEWLRNCGLLSGAIGFIAIWKAVDRAKKEDDEAKKRHEELIDTIRDINKWDK